MTFRKGSCSEYFISFEITGLQPFGSTLRTPHYLANGKESVSWEDSEGGEKTFSSQGWDFCIISKRRSLESIPGSLPVESSNAALHYYLCLSPPPTNLSAHLRCWGEAACRSDVPVCKMVTSICCSEELVSHAAELTSLWEHSWVQDVQNSHPLKCLLRKRSDLPSQ